MLFLLIGCSIPDTEIEEIEWCINNMPQFNTSSMDGLITPYKQKLGIVQQKCFTNHWSIYCKYSYPEYCPE